jgi:PTH1 family peptidyl-tRNA hydrolase
MTAGGAFREVNSLKLIVGLGNPGLTYAHTRHNVGFMLADRLSEQLEGAGEKKQGRALVRTANAAGCRLLLAKPQTFMNLSGDSVWELLNFYKDGIEDMIVIHDDLDLPLGKIRFKSGGGAGGHRGLKSITQQLGNDKYDRLKIGIGRPPERMTSEAYVLQAFSIEEKGLLDKVLEAGVQGLCYWLTEGCGPAMNKFNATDLRPATPEPEKPEPDKADGTDEKKQQAN